MLDVALCTNNTAEPEAELTSVTVWDLVLGGIVFTGFFCDAELPCAASFCWRRLWKAPSYPFTLWLWAASVAGDARIEQVLACPHHSWILWVSGLPETRGFLCICFMDICGPFRHNHYDPCIFQLHTLWLFLQSAVELPGSPISKASAYKILKIKFKKNPHDYLDSKS